MNFQQRRGSLQLWQFLIALLDEPASKYVFMRNKACIRIELYVPDIEIETKFSRESHFALVDYQAKLHM